MAVAGRAEAEMDWAAEMDAAAGSVAAGPEVVRNHFQEREVVVVVFGAQADLVSG